VLQLQRNDILQVTFCSRCQVWTKTVTGREVDGDDVTLYSSSSSSTYSTLTQAFPTFKTLFNRSLPGWLLILLLLIPLRLNSCLSDSKTNLPKYTTLHLTPPALLWNLGFIFDEHLTFSNQITALSNACYCHFVNFAVFTLSSIRQRPTIATSIVHCQLDYCNSLYHNLPKSQFSRLQQIQNSLARTVVKALKSCHITPILCSLNWLRITERIEYKLLSLTYRVLTTTQPPYLHKLISTQRLRSTRSSSVVTLARPPSSSSLKITDRSLRYASPCLWNQLPLSLRQHHSGTSSYISDSPIPSPMTSFSSDSPLCSSITPSLFHFFIKTYLFHKSYSP